MKKTRRAIILNMIKISLVAASYFVLTVLIAPLSYGEIQIRFAEILLILCVFDKRYAISLIIGCALANIASPFGVIDIIFGTMQTAVAAILIGHLRPVWLSLILATLSMVIIGVEIAYLTDLSMWWLLSLQVMAGEAIVLFVIAYPLSFVLRKSKTFMNIVQLT